MKKSDKSENLFSAIAEIHGQARTTIPMPAGQVAVNHFNDESDDLTINAAPVFFYERFRRPCALSLNTE